MTTTTSLSRDGTPGDDRVPTGGRHLTGGTDERPVAAASAEPTPTAAAPAPRAGAPHDQHHARRWLVLGVVAVAQLMVVLDATIVNIALPSAQRALGFADTDRQWVVTAYALAFGSLLLLGGKLGDLFGRKTTFVTGLVGFAVASALGGAAQSFGVLVGARVLQGVFGALLAPAALATLATTFTDPKERSKAFGIFGAVAGGGSAVGLVLGGVLTEWLSWRWCLYVNLLFAAVAVAGALVLLHNPRDRVRPKLDLPGTLLASAGLFCLVFGFSHAATKGWTDAVTLGALALGVLLLVVFVLVQQRVAAPLLPLHIVLNRVRGTSYAAVGLSAIAIFAVFLFLTYYLQQVQGFTPIVTGLAFLPLTAGIVTASTSANIILLPRTGAPPAAAARDDARRDRDVLVHSADADVELRRRGAPVPGDPRPRLRPDLRAVLHRRDVRGRPPGDRRRVGDAEHDAAGRRLDRDRTAVHTRGQRDEELRPCAHRTRRPGAGSGARLHHRVHRLRCDLRGRRSADRDAAAVRGARRAAARAGTRARPGAARARARAGVRRTSRPARPGVRRLLTAAPPEPRRVIGAARGCSGRPPGPSSSARVCPALPGRWSGCPTPGRSRDR